MEITLSLPDVAQVAKPARERNADGKRAGLATCATSDRDFLPNLTAVSVRIYK
jgi:hypothetical protein